MKYYVILLSIIFSLPSFANSRCYISKTREVIEGRTDPPIEGYECIVKCQDNQVKSDFDIMEFDNRKMVDKVLDWLADRDPKKTYGCKLNESRRDARIEANNDRLEAAKAEQELKKAESSVRMERIKTQCDSASGLTRDLCEELLNLKGM